MRPPAVILAMVLAWVRINDDRHQFGETRALCGDPRVYGRLYVGTGGRGILYGEPAGDGH